MILIILKTQLQNDFIPLFDLHCDTLLELYNHKASIVNNNLHISLNKASAFSPYFQVCAIWSNSSLSNDEAYEIYNKVVKYSKNQLSFSKSEKNFSNNSFILSVEDARILNGDISRLDILYNDGVRILTLNWRGNSIIGGGWDTSSHLTEFGKEVIKKCFDYGIIPDVSHSSINTINDAFILAEQYKKPIVASHSNAYDICNHKRNIIKEHFKWLVANSSLLGVSLASEHLSNLGRASISDILRHIDYFLNLGGENTVCLGCDFDGVTTLPSEISSISDLKILYYEFKQAFGEKIAKKIFFENAYSFMKKALK